MVCQQLQQRKKHQDHTAHGLKQLWPKQKNITAGGQQVDKNKQLDD
jgi:hypothetical protein